MTSIFKKLFKINSSPTIETYYPNKSDATDKYFQTMQKWVAAKISGNYELIADITLKNVKTIPKFIEEQIEDYGSFGVKSIPALQHGALILALLGRKEELIIIKNIIDDVPELTPWILKIDQQIENVDLFKRIVDVITKNNTIIQSEIKNLVGCNDGHRVANLVYWLEKTGKIVRIKKEGTYIIKIADESTFALVAKPNLNVQSHRVNNKSKKCKEIDLDSIPYVSLPKAPYYWEEWSREKENSPISSDKYFEIESDGCLKIISVELLSKDEKPDPAFRKFYKTGSGLIIVDDLGNSKISDTSPVAVMYFDKQGKKVIEKPLEFDIYRIGVNPHNKSFIAMSRQCVIHAYDYLINPLLSTAVQNYPEIIKLIKKFEIRDGKLNNNIRSVSLSLDNTRYIFTCVDEVWCISIDGECLWGAKLPLKDGYQKVSSSSKTNTSKEIDDALKTMELQFPITNDQIKNKYKELAKIWHPDLNQGSEKSKDRMQEINFAIETLMGVNIGDIQNITEDLYVSKQSSHKISMGDLEITASIEFTGDASFAADWIYASAFSESGHNSYIGGYSGKIIELDPNGEPIIMYDIGSAPEEIIPTKEFLYILTKTRLYILQNSSLINLIDVYKEGKIIITQNGFGLLQDKKLQWFEKDGNHIGNIKTKAPIRRVYYSLEGLVIETRTHRAIIDGINNWWGET